jgi:spermidine dehydrogenase
MSYETYLVKHLGVGPAVARFHDRHLASIVGLGCDAVSAFTAYGLAMPGFRGYASRGSSQKLSDVNPALHSYPGGNDGLMRHFVKALLPEAISGNRMPDQIHNGRIRFGELDRPGRPIRFRLGATTVRVEGKGDPVAMVTFLIAGRLYRVRARTVVAACGGWVAKHLVRDLPQSYGDALAALPRAPILVVNVAVRHWRYLVKLGITAGRWTEGFGFAFNLRRPMVVGRYRPPFHPDRPTVLTFYVPFCFPGDSAVGQGARGREELFSRSYHDYERIIRNQLSQMFDAGGFDPANDIAGIVLNRWGHAYVVPTPGFYSGRDGKPAPRDVLREASGRIAFAHSELTGHQTWGTAVTEGRRAAEQVAALLR